MRNGLVFFVCSVFVFCGGLDGVGKVLEVDGSVVCDEEGFIVDFFVVEGSGGGCGGGKEEFGSE